MLTSSIFHPSFFNHMSRYYTYLKYGHLGKGVRLEIPTCVLQQIRHLYSEDDEKKYMGFKAATAEELAEDEQEN